MERYSIRELSNLAGVSARTLRYYDEIGLLKPLYVNEAGYRFYGENEVLLLQQILFYKERGFGLQEIKQAVYQEDFDIIGALESHLLVFEKQRDYVDSLIRTVKQTILQMKGERKMSAAEKFEAFKKNTVKENEEKYGEEIRRKYGETEIDEANNKLLNMSEEDYKRFQELEAEIRSRLTKAVRRSGGYDSSEAEQIVKLHKEWLCMTWKNYTKAAHVGITEMYVCDERFTKYYDADVDGCTRFLKEAVAYWAR